MADFWRKKIFDLEEFGYYHIFQIVGGEHSGEYFYVVYADTEEFKDYMTLDEHSCIRYTCELYKMVTDAISDGSINYFTSMGDCINSILMDIYKSKPNEETVTRIIKIISMKLENQGR